MGTSEKTFNQVKAILSKLDRNIDELRDKRLHPQPAGLPVPPAAPGLAPIIAPVAAPAVNGRPTFGRAQPIRPDRP
ncbi:MAG: hypothetical protein IT436_16405 [Phycisphaerales bacterium]|nr:hypothetical protein [Phycisphaerales bacterium]